MDAERHRLLTELFLRACELPPEERGTVLDEACAGDPALRAEVEALLEVEGEGEDWLENPGRALGGLLADTRERTRGERIGQYTIVRLIGSGGSGDVYLAQQSRPRREVAIKVMRQGLTRESAKRRFEFEAQLLARLNHPGVAQVYEADVFEDRGRRVPYFVMEYVEGARSITEHVRAEGLDVRRRLLLFTAVCEAVAHGHQQGVVHCDIKPENVLVQRSGHARVIDFGIARAAERDPHLTTLESGAYSVAGTLPYMSPEQVSGDPGAIDQRSDVYALGVLCFEMLTGRLPLELQRKSIPEAVHAIANEELLRLGAVDPRLRGDLETIVSKALEKERARRYDNATELAADVRRYLRNEPILARRPTTLYQLRKFARRHRGLVAGGTLAVSALVLGALVAVQQAVVANQREATSRWQAYRASIAAAAAALAGHEVALARVHLEDAPPSHRDWEWQHLAAGLDDAVWSVELSGEGLAGSPAFVVRDGRPALSVLRGGRLSSFDLERRAPLAEAAAQAFACDPVSGTTAVVARGRMRVERPGADVLELGLGGLGLPLDGLDAFGLSPGAGHAALLTGSRAFRFDLTTQATESVTVERAGTGVAAFDLAADGRMALAAAVAGRPALWDPGAVELTPLAGVQGFARSIAFDARGELLALGRQDAELELWDLARGERVGHRSGHGHAVTAVRFLAAGRLVSGSLDRTLRIWSTDALEPLAVLQGHARGVRHVSASPDGRWLASTSEDGSLRLWDALDLATDGELRGHAALVFPVSFSADGALVASAGSDGSVRLWDARTHLAVAALPVPLPIVTALAFSPDGRRLVAVGGGGSVLYELDGGRLVAGPRLPVRERAVRDLAFLADGARVVIPDELEGAGVRVWELDAGALGSVPIDELPAGLAPVVDPSGRYAVLYAPDPGASGEARRADSDSGARLVVRELARGRALDLPPLSGAFAFRPRGADVELAARLRDDPTRIGLFDLERGELLGTLAGHGDVIYSLAYSPSGTRLASSARDGVRLWNTGEAGRRASEGGDGQGVVELRGHRSFVWSVAWSPDGALLATGSGDGTVRLWDTRSFAEIEAARAARSAAQPAARVEALLAELGSPAAVARALREDVGLDADERARLRNALIARHRWQ